MAAGRRLASAIGVSLALHLVVIAAAWRSPALRVAGAPRVMEVELALSPRAPAQARDRPSAVAALRSDPVRPPPPPDRPDDAGGEPASPVSPPPPLRPAGQPAPDPVASPVAPAASGAVEDPVDAWIRTVWAAIDRRRPRSVMGATAARVAFSVDREGRLTGLRLAGSSGAPAFDREAMRAVRSAAPFSPPPPGVDARRLRFEILIRSAATSR
jgi:protein TonB